ncbi:MAG: ABC transporter permease [Candidatus Methylumidiphilus alinenensis]|uniref:ABC transporter permease n=1 Tax=Candidatus Methylumidiphilus alinenensis TaxID=2202197 RepID=A0A2W4QP42_9GAMM|nr:MAG: ABC transporter permease [Candidatus Methylumidiphilus alinenensis]
MIAAIALLSAWILIAFLGLVDSVFLPSPFETLKSFFKLLSLQFFEEQLVPSTIRILFAFLLSVIIAFPLGLLSSQNPFVRKMILPVCSFARYLPVAAFVPLCILWFGIGDGQKVAVIMLGVTFPLVLLIAADTASTPTELIETGRTFGLSKAEIVRRIVLPWALPAIWEDLRISAGWAWSYLILAELVAGNSGIGYFVVQSQRYLETANVFAGILFIGLLGLLTDLIFRIIGSRLFRWV